MLNSLRTFLGRKTAQLRLCFKKRSSIPVNCVLRPGRNILICLPEDGDAAETLELLKTELNPRNIFVLAEDHQNIAEFPFGMKVFSLSEKGLSLLCLPKGSLMKEVRKQGIDIAIDLHWRFSLPSAYLCAHSGAVLRIGFHSPQAHPFFNLEYHGRRFSPETCRELIRLLGNISDLGRRQPRFGETPNEH
jgi:hypothetical protein